MLKIVDPLKDKTVVITVRVMPGAENRDERTAMVMVGVPDEPPVMTSGKYSQMLDLINDAWSKHGEMVVNGGGAAGDQPGDVLDEVDFGDIDFGDVL